MDFFTALRISSSALSAQRIRLNVISSNLANVHTTRTEKGGPYVRKDVIFAAAPLPLSFQELIHAQFKQELRECKVVDIIDDPRPPLVVYDPGHPDANPQGYVLMPNISAIEEMVNMISATRSYEANVAAVNAIKSMATSALEIGRGA